MDIWIKQPLGEVRFAEGLLCVMEIKSGNKRVIKSQ